MNDYSAPNLQSYVLRTHGLREEDVFKKLSKERKTSIINELFLKHTGYHLTNQGLSSKDGKDCFDAYKNFDDIRSYQHLERDIAQTIKRNKRPFEKLKRLSHLKSKQKFREKQQENIEKLDDEAYLLKWSPDTKGRHDKLLDLKKKREQEQNKGYERNN